MKICAKMYALGSNLPRREISAYCQNFFTSRASFRVGEPSFGDEALLPQPIVASGMPRVRLTASSMVHDRPCSLVTWVASSKVYDLVGMLLLLLLSLLLLLLCLL
eukprot:CAMPEP_0172868992 /NCGR_PEP_ID=MMETSP1075-20121228/87821_1 /TAXON_ID=2916 /ORGANISM="Ceratium fusus, Strain PA161109" /LENGTH=104 /DNA_ID=CAMNT_0013718783 /DNA_START=124 /DNA_END=438 /DNA_ORIENTATION=-